ncbi:hypothetical protein T4B_572 [Trichinella pseudospiralis]|uniref:Uncharacterized protein n=1 Tax=Trichinella pseudospiralis TaxID=6337 RepID=A0A0V1ITE4_TRIPS|nr:hypothetical protein T4B_572 [Trichinella pseudospiralis]
MAELLHLAWELTEAFMFEHPGLKHLLLRPVSVNSKSLPNRTDGSYTFSSPHIMSGPHQQGTPQWSDANQQVFVSNPLLITILLPCEKAVG